MFRGFHALAGILALSLAGCGHSLSSQVRAAERSMIVGGEDAKGDEPFAASTAALSDKFGPLCTVTLISESVALTAAHCVTDNPRYLMLVFGTNADPATPEQKISRQVEEYEVSPFWADHEKKTEDFGDIALIRFSGGLPPGFHAVTVVTDQTLLSDGETVLLAGFGDNDGVDRKGTGILRSTQSSILKTDFSVSELSVDQSAGHGVCYGDSGGPAYVEVDGRLEVAGVTSRGGTDNCTGFSIFTSVPHYADWIARTKALLEAKASSNQSSELARN